MPKTNGSTRRFFDGSPARARRPDYLPISDYAVLGDTESVALVGLNGSIDWCCLPHFDSPAAFCRILDAGKGGYFSVHPVGAFSAVRTYVGDTNVLATTFEAQHGVVRLTDFMAVQPRSHGSADVAAHPTHDVLRLVEGISGEVEVEVTFRPTFGYASQPTQLFARPGGAVAQGPDDTLAMSCAVALEPSGDGGLAGRLRVSAGDRHWISLAYQRGKRDSVEHPLADDPDTALREAVEYWGRWSAQSTYAGPYEPLVRRSALVLKLLTFSPTGAIVAAPTTSLPEEIGGERNWDYRFSWLRDSSLLLSALQSLGHHAEAERFFEWLERVCIECREKLQIMFTIAGGTELPERVLDHLHGYRGSRPVRIGNAAADQDQLDVFGEILDAAHVHFSSGNRSPQPQAWELLRDLADRAARRWREPDRGIWEVRGPARHFLYSKLLCWVALDRAERLARRHGLGGDVERWRATAAEIRQAILTSGYDDRLGAFTQAFDHRVLDASALAIPLVGFLPATDPRVRSTAERIRSQLTAGGLVYRYAAEDARDGLSGGEATFALCSFWLVDNLALSGRVDEARELFERVTGYANDVGLLSEQIEPATGSLLGNHPQGFTHLGLVRSALAITKAESIGPERDAHTESERQHEAEAAQKEAV